MGNSPTKPDRVTPQAKSAPPKNEVEKVEKPRKEKKINIDRNSSQQVSSSTSPPQTDSGKVQPLDPTVTYTYGGRSMTVKEYLVQLKDAQEAADKAEAARTKAVEKKAEMHAKYQAAKKRADAVEEKTKGDKDRIEGLEKLLADAKSELEMADYQKGVKETLKKKIKALQEELAGSRGRIELLEGEVAEAKKRGAAFVAPPARFPGAKRSRALSIGEVEESTDKEKETRREKDKEQTSNLQAATAEIAKLRAENLNLKQEMSRNRAGHLEWMKNSGSVVGAQQYEAKEANRKRVMLEQECARLESLLYQQAFQQPIVYSPNGNSFGFPPGFVPPPPTSVFPPPPPPPTSLSSPPPPTFPTFLPPPPNFSSFIPPPPAPIILPPTIPPPKTPPLPVTPWHQRNFAEEPVTVAVQSRSSEMELEQDEYEVY